MDNVTRIKYEPDEDLITVYIENDQGRIEDDNMVNVIEYVPSEPIVKYEAEHDTSDTISVDYNTDYNQIEDNNEIIHITTVRKTEPEIDINLIIDCNIENGSSASNIDETKTMLIDEMIDDSQESIEENIIIEEDIKMLNTTRSKKCNKTIFKCIFCSKVFRKMKALQKHMSIHSDSSNIVDAILKQPFNTMSYTEQLKVKAEGRATPNRIGNACLTFYPSLYDNFTWLTSSQIEKCFYCWPCLLFSKKDIWNTIYHKKDLPKSAAMHENEINHTQCELQLRLFGIDLSVPKKMNLAPLNDCYNKRVRRNREFLKPLIDITSLLVRQQLPFTHNDEFNPNYADVGNFQKLFDIWCKRDEDLAQFFDKSEIVSIQQDLIHSIAHVTQTKILKEIESASFLAWQIDEITDISVKNKLSIILRYVHNLDVIERFIGFFDVSENRDELSVLNILLKEMDQFNLKNKLIAQTYGGPVATPTELKILQHKIKDVATHALFLQNHNQCINLTLSEGTYVIPKSKIFFSDLSAFYLFFSKSAELIDLLNMLKSSSGGSIHSDFSSPALEVVDKNREILIDILTTVRQTSSTDILAIQSARGLISTLRDFEFVFLLKTYIKIFNSISFYRSILSHNPSSILLCEYFVGQQCIELNKLKSDANFRSIFAAVMECKDIPILDQSGTFSQRMYDLYCSIISNIIEQIEIRCIDYAKLSFIQLLTLDNGPEQNDKVLDNILHTVQVCFKSYFNIEKLKKEINIFYSNKNMFGEFKNIPSKFFDFIAFNEIDKIMPELTKLLKILMTLPSAPIDADTSDDRVNSTFSRMKRYINQTPGEERKTNLALLVIEKNLVKELEKTSTWYDDVIEYFANMNDRRSNFLYKCE